MSFDGQTFDKKITVREENSLTPKEVEIVPGGTVDTKTTVVSSQTVDRTLTLPDLTDTLVGLDGVQTLTHKTLVVSANTITTAASGIITSTELNSAIAEIAQEITDVNNLVLSVSEDLQDHIADPTGAHAASAISFSDVTYPGVANVAEALLAVQSSGGVTQEQLDDHIADTATHGATGAVVGTTNTQTLTNKTLTSPTLNTPVINSPTGLVKADVGLGNVDNTSDATKNSATATLTNKTIVAANNTITTTAVGSISATEINAVIAQVSTQLADKDTAINTVANNLLNHELNTGTLSVHGATGAVVGTTNTQTLTNKTLTSPTVTGGTFSSPAITTPTGIVKGDVGLGNVDNTSDATKNSAAVTLTNKTFGDAPIFTQISTPATPSAGTNKIYPKSDNKFYNLNSAGVETPLGSGAGGGAKNYLGSINGVDNNGNFEAGTSSPWSKFNTTLTNKIPTGTITLTAASINTFAASASSPLAGTFSLWVTSSGAFAAGDGFISPAFTLDAEDLGKVLTASFYYQLTGTGLVGAGTSANTFAFYLYDVANSQWVQPSGVYSMSSLNTIGLAQGQFQTASNATQYRLAVICITASGGATDLHFDDFTVSPSQYVYGTPVTDIVNTRIFTPSAGFGAVNLADYRTSSVGDKLVGHLHWKCGTTTTTVASLALPAGMQINSSKYSTTTNVNVVGMWRSIFSGANTSMVATSSGPIFYDGTDTSNLYFAYQSGTNQLTKAQGIQILASNDGVEVDIWALPILGWSSSVQMSDSADTRVVDFVGYKPAGQAVTANVTDITYTTIKDSHGAWNGSAYIIPVPGDYRITVNGSASGTTNVRVYVNTTLVREIFDFNSATNTSGTVVVPNLMAGQSLTIRSSNSLTINGNAAVTTVQTLNIEKISGPSAIAATELIAAHYQCNSGMTIANSGTGTVLICNLKKTDTHGAYNTSTGEYTVPAAGYYDISTSAAFAVASMAVSTSLEANIFIDGVLYAASIEIVDNAASDTKGTTTVTVHGVRLLAGQKVTSVIYQNSGSSKNILTGSGAYTNFSISRN